MPTLWDAATREGLCVRIRTLTADRPGRWGTMDAPKMVSHLIESARMALGELPLRVRPTPVQYFPVKHLVLYAPFPRGAPTAPKLLARTPERWPDDLARLEALLAQLAARDPSAPQPLHPLFGRMSHREWGYLVWKHTDHHLRQFGA
jgi:hypothetical protein